MLSTALSQLCLKLLFFRDFSAILILCSVKKYRSGLSVSNSSKKCKLSFDRKEPLKQIQEEDNVGEMASSSPDISSIHTDENGEMSGLLYHTVSDDSDENAEGTDEEEEIAESSDEEEEDWEEVS